jgi:aminoglycoside phosphotransferase (APT) family kinase protein
MTLPSHDLETDALIGTATEEELARLGRWMDEQGVDGVGAPTLTPLSGGSQNVLNRVERGGVQLAMRRPGPAGAADGGRTLLREIRVLRALAGTEVPHAELVAGCEDLGVLGTPFYLMRLVDGWSPLATMPGWPEPYASEVAARADLAFELVGGIARLATVDWQARGLTGLGRPEGFHDRQVDRWLDFLAAFQFRELPGLEAAAAWLRTHRPAHWSPGIMHGDYQFANVMYQHTTPARLAAIVDWEMTTVGDPMLDLGWCLSSWGQDAGAAGGTDLTGMPSRDALLDHYATISGRSVDDVDYYVVLARFKLGIVLEKTVAREGLHQGRGAVFAPIVLEQIRTAASLAAATS